MNTVPASPTAVNTFLTCPRQFEAKYITRTVTFTPTEATIYGDRAHKALEARLVAGTPLPAEFAKWEPLAAAVVSKPGTLRVEHRLPFDEAGDACDWRQRYAGGIADWLVVHGPHAWLGDWKTGAYHPDKLQLSILTVGVFAHFPEVRHVRAALVFTKTGDLHTVPFTRQTAYDDGLKTTLNRYFHAQSASLYPPRPSGLCRQWCPVTTRTRTPLVCHA